MNFYDTQNTRLRNSDQYELAYDKRSSVVRGHAVALRQKIAAHAMYNWAPSSSNAFNKVINLGSNTFDFDVIIDLANWYKNFDVNDGSIHLSLCPDHEAWLQKADSKLYKAIYQSGQAEIYGVKLHSYSKNPRYDGDGAKKAFGSANLSTDKQSSVAWIDSEVMSAFGTVDMFDNQKDAKERADLIGFQQRALAMSIRNKYSCAILK